MPNLGPQFINQSYQDLLQITSSNAVQKGDGTNISSLAITSSTTSGVAPAITNNTNNNVLTATGGETINGESNLTFNGSDLSVSGMVNADIINTTTLEVNGFVGTNLSPVDSTYNLLLGESNRTWNQVHVGTSDGGKTAFFGEDLLDNPDKLFIRTDSDLEIRAQGGLTLNGSPVHASSLINNTLTNTGTITTPSLTSTNLANTNSASFGGNFTPTARVHISGANADNLLRVGSPTNANILFVSGSGNVGMGTATPVHNLVVDGASGISINAGGTTFPNIHRDSSDGGMLLRSWNGSAFTNNVKITPTSNVGIGTTSPSAKLHISGATADKLLIVSASTTTPALFVSGSGRVGIGTSNPINQLHVAGGNISLDFARYIDFGNGNSRITDVNLTSGQGYPLAFSTYGPIAAGASNSITEKLRLTGSGSLGLGTTNPLARLHVSASDGNEFFRITSGSQNILNIRSGSAVFFAGTGTAPTANFDLDIQGTGTANGGSVRIAGDSTVYSFRSGGSITRTGTGNSEMFGMTMGGSSNSFIQNPLRVEFNANQSATAGYTVLRLNATHTAVGSGNKLLQTWEFGGTQRSVVNITGSIGVGITTPSASIHISSSLGLPPMLALTPHHPLPTTNVPTGSFMVSASTPPRPYMWDGASWYAL